MKVQRAKKIAASFSQGQVLQVEADCGGLLVHYRGMTSYFVREAYFWPFLYRIAGVLQDTE